MSSSSNHFSLNSSSFIPILSERKVLEASRYGFNKQEKDNEISGGVGNDYTATFWEYDARIGRRFNLDTKPKEYYSPFSTFSNNHISKVDTNGVYDCKVAKGVATIRVRTTKEKTDRIFNGDFTKCITMPRGILGSKISAVVGDKEPARTYLVSAQIDYSKVKDTASKK